MSSRTRCLVVCLLMLLAACGTVPPGARGAGRTAGVPSTATTQGAAVPATTDPAVPSWPGGPVPLPFPVPVPGPAATGSAAELAGRRIVYSYPGPTPPPSLLTAVREGRAAGVIFFGENTADPAAFRAAVAALRRAQHDGGGRSPLLLMTDQEGGLVRRLPGAPELSARQVSQAPDPLRAAYEAGAGAGRTLADAGLNVNLAPVLDVYAAPGNFIDTKQRSFGSDPRTVALLTAAFTTGQVQQGVAATAKHFPGLGTAPAGANTDQRPVTLTDTPEQLRTVGEAPYPAAIAAGARLVMLSWGVYPALDAMRPAGLSPVVVQQELRGRLGFTGVTVSDALEAGSLAAFGDTEARAVAAAAAGVDLILCSDRDTAQGDRAAAALAAALGDGTLDRAAFTGAVARVDALRAGLH